MGIIDNVVKQYVTKQEVKGEELAKVLEKNLDKELTITFKPKGNVAKQMIGGAKDDSVLIVKNAYHRARISITNYKNPATSEVEYYFNFDFSEISPVLKFIAEQTGLIGRAILGAIYGKADTLYDSVFDIIMKEYNAETRETQVGLKALFGKKE